MIDVIVPVYRSAEHTRRALASVLAAAQRGPFALVVVDDASPEPELAAHVDALARDGAITLLRNEANRGFAASVNRGMALHPDRDVVLLNSDTEVANDWLDRLSRACSSSREIGTATPFSNNATICSYPFHGWEGGVPGSLGLAALDRLLAQANAGEVVDIPTAVGFCMYIRRECLAAVGPFDEKRFAGGYGEENEFCMRAAAAGWRHVLAADVFVFHAGSVSFGQARNELTEEAARTLLAAHPDYDRKVNEFVARDPAGPLRHRVDLARLACGLDEARHVLTERAMERAFTRSLLRAADERTASVARGLAHAEALVAERDRALAQLSAQYERALAERDEEIGRLRGGLAHAERLAFDRADELERIRRTWLGKCLAALARAKA